MCVFYGTSSVWNTGEVLLVDLASRYTGLPGMFFTYPTTPDSWRWQKDYVDLFSPEDQPDPLGLVWPGVELTNIFFIIKEAGVADLKFGEIVWEVKKSRKKNVLVAWRKKGEKIIPVRSQDHELEPLREMTLIEVATSPHLKLGGSVIYYIIGCYMRRNPEALIVLPRRPKPGVLENLRDGWGTWDENRIITSGMLDIVTESQMEFYTKGEYKTAPPELVVSMITNELLEELTAKVLINKEDCLVVINKERGGVAIEEWMKDVWG